MSAAVFTAASGGTNFIYGWQKGTDLPTSLVWSGVAGAVAIVFALSWPALIRSVDTKRYSAALITLVAMLLSGAYSLTAALGSAAGGRANAAAAETATTDARTKAQSAYDTAKAELDSLGVARPAAEIQALIETTKVELARLPASRSVAEVEASLRGAQREPQRYGCALVNGSMALSCPKLDGELARARQRERLDAKIVALAGEAGRAEQRLQERRTAARAARDKASGELAKIQPARVANSDAKALVRYLGALGLEVTLERLGDLLVLLAVLMIEAGGGLSLALGMALQQPVSEPGASPASAPVEQSDQPLTPARNARGAYVQAERSSVFTSGVQSADIVELVRGAGGLLRTTTRRLGAQVQRSAACVHGELRRLALAGLITLNTDRRGTVITLNTHSRLN